jgi:hypothetical protein
VSGTHLPPFAWPGSSQHGKAAISRPQTSQPTKCDRKNSPNELEIFSGGWTGYTPPTFQVGASTNSFGSMGFAPPTV